MKFVEIHVSYCMFVPDVLGIYAQSKSCLVWCMEYGDRNQVINP
ncbi:hypothetical protein SLEP1_g58695 [Rubroshorea leprosula]|uniref:Uncharacterized protein n=1 Tax=Rubroshorea leprosula TaxID=152421 RepID=A0AAV5MTE4_9ROSI|nr:hypothetical protein SLEP1_g58695 [Rubroshorea leprosula]